MDYLFGFAEILRIGNDRYHGRWGIITKTQIAIIRYSDPSKRTCIRTCPDNKEKTGITHEVKRLKSGLQSVTGSFVLLLRSILADG